MRIIKTPNAWVKYWRYHPTRREGQSASSFKTGNPPLPGAVFDSGMMLSIQAGELYRSHIGFSDVAQTTGTVSAFELAFPSWPDLMLLDYAEEPENPCETVYNYVPLSVMGQFFRTHGGIIGYTKWDIRLDDEPIVFPV